MIRHRVHSKPQRCIDRRVFQQRYFLHELVFAESNSKTASDQLHYSDSSRPVLRPGRDARWVSSRFSTLRKRKRGCSGKVGGTPNAVEQAVFIKAASFSCHSDWCANAKDKEEELDRRHCLWPHRKGAWSAALRRALDSGKGQRRERSGRGVVSPAFPGARTHLHPSPVQPRLRLSLGIFCLESTGSPTHHFADVGRSHRSGQSTSGRTLLGASPCRLQLEATKRTSWEHVCFGQASARLTSSQTALLSQGSKLLLSSCFLVTQMSWKRKRSCTADALCRRDRPGEEDKAFLPRFLLQEIIFAHCAFDDIYPNQPRLLLNLMCRTDWLRLRGNAGTECAILPIRRLSRANISATAR